MYYYYYSFSGFSVVPQWVGGVGGGGVVVGWVVVGWGLLGDSSRG